MSIPKRFNQDGLLDPGTYDASFSDIRSSILVSGDESSDTWDKSWRAVLVDRAEVLVKQLWKVGVDDVFLDGSFVEDKDHPNDIDGYFDPNFSMYDPEDMKKFETMVSKLNSLDPHKVWTWDPRSRRSYRGYAKKQLPMWLFYRVEFYPHLSQGTGIKDKYGNDLQFPSAFRRSRNNYIPKGIVRVRP